MKQRGDVDCLQSLLHGQLHISTDTDSESIQQMLSQFAFLWIVGSNQQWLAPEANLKDRGREVRMGDGEAFTLNLVDAICQSTQQQIADAIVQEIDLIDVEDPSVRLSQ